MGNYWYWPLEFCKTYFSPLPQKNMLPNYLCWDNEGSCFLWWLPLIHQLIAVSDFNKSFRILRFMYIWTFSYHSVSHITHFQYSYMSLTWTLLKCVVQNNDIYWIRSVHIQCTLHNTATCQRVIETQWSSDMYFLY